VIPSRQQRALRTEVGEVDFMKISLAIELSRGCHRSVTVGGLRSPQCSDY